jgi:hypothetical protein
MPDVACLCLVIQWGVIKTVQMRLLCSRIQKEVKNNNP